MSLQLFTGRGQMLVNRLPLRRFLTLTAGRRMPILCLEARSRRNPFAEVAWNIASFFMPWQFEMKLASPHTGPEPIRFPTS
jgi:hypothetical protein